jgi:hypothetical protein
VQLRDVIAETPMWSAGFVVWACSLVGLACAAAPTPNASIIQSAYDREASNGSKLHDKGLSVIEARCDDPKAGQFLCQVTFLSKTDPSQRLYFDVVAVARTDNQWELKSGLCKR